MKKTFKLIDLDCANCARKMEESIQKDVLKVEGILREEGYL